MDSLPVKFFNAFVSSALATVIVCVCFLQFREDAHARGGGWSSPPQTGTPAYPQPPTPTDTDGDGLPNSWEIANAHDPENPNDARGDFDMDGVTALQEYQLGVSSGGESGHALGKWKMETLAAPTGFASVTVMNLVQCSSNGIVLVRIQGRKEGATGAKSHAYVRFPDSGAWTEVTMPAAYPSAISVTPLDVNSSGQVVGHFSSGGTIHGFLWTPDANGGSSVRYTIQRNGATVGVVPTKISDTGYLIGGIGGPGTPQVAADENGREIVFPGGWSNFSYSDVNDFGEFVGAIFNPASSTYEYFVAMEGYPVFMTGMSAMLDSLPGFWGAAPDVDPESIVWDSGSPGMEYRTGTGLDRDTNQTIPLYQGMGVPYYWGYQGGWYAIWQFTPTFGAINDWGEFSGGYGVTAEEMEYVSGSLPPLHTHQTQGVYFYDGDFHVSQKSNVVYGATNDPRVLTGTPFALWVDSVSVPVEKLIPAGFPTAFAGARMADNGVVILKQTLNGTNDLYILTPDQDADGDGMPDDWEVLHGLNPEVDDSNDDADNDGTNNLGEFLLNSNPNLAPVYGENGVEIDLRPGIDTDGDGIPNVWEWQNGLDYEDPSDALMDHDRDGYTNLQEFHLDTDPRGAPAFRIKEIGPFPGALSVLANTAAFGTSQTGDPGNPAGLIESVFFTATPSGTSQIARPAVWSAPRSSDQGTLSSYPPYPGSLSNFEVARSVEGAAMVYHSANPITLVYWQSPASEPVIFSGAANACNIKQMGTCSFSPSGNFMAGARTLASNNSTGLFYWKMPGGGASTVPVELTVPPALGITISPASASLQVNDWGYILGTGSQGGVSRSVLWHVDPETGEVDCVALAPLASGAQARAIGLSNSDQPVIAGNSSNLAGNPRGVLWSSSGAVSDPGPAAGTPSSFDLISYSGLVAGTWTVAPDGVAKTQVVIGKAEAGTAGAVSCALKSQGEAMPLGGVLLQYLADSGEATGTCVTADSRTVPVMWRHGRWFPLDSLLPPSSGYTLVAGPLPINAEGSLLVPAYGNGYSCRLLLTPDRDTDGDGLPDAFENAHSFNPFLMNNAGADADNDGVTDLEEYRNGTDPRNADSDSDGMSDHWEITWGLLPLDPSDATLDPDGDGLSNLREFRINTNPTGVYKLETLVSDAAELSVHSVGDDASVVYGKPLDGNPYQGTDYRLISAVNGSGQRDTVDLPDTKTRTWSQGGTQYSESYTSQHFNAGGGAVNSYVKDYASSGATVTKDLRYLVERTGSTNAEWHVFTDVVGDLVATGVPNASGLTSEPAVASHSGTRRIHGGTARLILDEGGSRKATLPMESYSLVNDSGVAIRTKSRGVPAAGNIPARTVTDIEVSDGTTTKTFALPLEWFPAPLLPILVSFSDDGKAVIRRRFSSPYRTVNFEFHVLDTTTGSVSKVRRPGLDVDNIVSGSPENSRLVGTGLTPYQIVPDGSCIRLGALRIKSNPTAEPQALSTFGYTIVPRHVTSDGTITLTASGPSSQKMILQLVPSNDLDEDGMPDDWETEIGLDPTDGMDGGLDPDGDGLVNSADPAPMDFYNGLMPTLSVSDYLEVKVTNAGVPVANAPLSFTRVSGDGGFPGGALSVTRRTGTNGKVSISDYLSPEDDKVRVTLSAGGNVQNVWLPAGPGEQGYITREGSNPYSYDPPNVGEAADAPEVTTIPPSPDGDMLVLGMENYLSYSAVHKEEYWSSTGLMFTTNTAIEYDPHTYEGDPTPQQREFVVSYGSNQQPVAYRPHAFASDDEMHELNTSKEIGENGSFYQAYTNLDIELDGDLPTNYDRMPTELGYLWAGPVDEEPPFASPHALVGQKPITLTKLRQSIFTDMNLIPHEGNVSGFIGPFISSYLLEGEDPSRQLTWNELSRNLIKVPVDGTKVLRVQVFSGGGMPPCGHPMQGTEWHVTSSNSDIFVQLARETEEESPVFDPTGSESIIAFGGASEKIGLAIKGAEDVNNASSIVTLSLRDKDGGIVVKKIFKVALSSSSSDEHPPTLNVLTTSLNNEESSGPKYRKIGLDGRPLRDEAPAAESTDDEEKEETYVDALSRELRHSTTDVYIPVPSSKLALTVRRNAASEIWSPVSGLYPTEDPALPFGPAWRSNLGAHVRIVEQKLEDPKPTEEIPDPPKGPLVAQVQLGQRKQLNLAQNDPNYAHVTDEDGSTHRFMIKYDAQGNRSYIPAPSGTNEKESFEMKLTGTQGGGFIFEKHHGNVLVFGAAVIDFEFNRIRIPEDFEGEAVGDDMGTGGFGNLPPARAAEGGGQMQSYRYHRLLSVQDRLGNKLNYHYSQQPNLVPVKIDVEGRPQLAIHIKSNPNGRITSVFDANGRETEYSYDNHGLLSGVSTAGAPIVSYGYRRWEEQDYRKTSTGSVSVVTGLPWVTVTREDGSKNSVQYEEKIQHLDLKSITDAAENTVSFTYNTDTSHYVMVPMDIYSPNANGGLNSEGKNYLTYPLSGYPPDVAEIHLPGDAVVLIGDSNKVLNSSGVPGRTYSERHTTVVDAEKNRRTYRWSGEVAIVVNEADLGYVKVTDEDEYHDLRTGGLIHDRNSAEMPNGSSTSTRFLYYTQMDIIHDHGAVEGYEFNYLAGCAVSSIRDISGNLTYYGHGGHEWGEPITLPPLSGGLGPLYRPEPTSEMDSLGRTDNYSYVLGEMDTIIEPDQYTTTTHGIDSLGRKTRKKVTNGANGVVEHVEYEYHATFPGFVKRETVKNEGVNLLTGGAYDWVKELTTLYQPDANGRVWKKAIDMNGNRTIDSADLVTEYAYDRNGNKLSETDPEGLVTWFHYDLRYRMAGVTHPDGTSTEIIRDKRGKKVLERDERGIATGFVYDERGRVLKTIRDMNGNLGENSQGLTGINPGIDLITETVYNKVSSPVRTVDARGYVTVTKYDALQRPVAVIKPGPMRAPGEIPVGRATDLMTEFEYGYNSGSSSFDSSGFRPTTTIDPRGFKVVDEYDSLYRKVGSFAQYSQDPPLYAASSNDHGYYDEMMSSVVSRTPVGLPGAMPASGSSVETRTTYDRLQRPLEVTEGYGIAGETRTASSYTTTGLVHEVKKFVQSSPSAPAATLFSTMRTEYDPAGRAVKTTLPAVPLDGGPATASPVTETEYNPSGTVARTVDARGHVTEFRYDARGRLIQTIHPPVEEPGRVDPVSPVVTTAYDAVGNVISTTDALGNVTVTEYDAANRVSKVTAPAVWDALAGQEVSPVTLTTYDPAGNITKVVDANGSVTLNTYDAPGRLVTTKTNPVVPASVATHAEDIVVRFDYDKAGNKTKVTDGKGQVTAFRFDGLNRPTATIWDADDASRKKELESSYDAAVLTSTRDARNWTVGFSYDALFRLEAKTCAQSPDDNEVRSYDPAGRLFMIQRAGSSGPLPDDPRNVTYAHDKLDRVIQETSAGSTHSYGYDLSGNRTKVHYLKTGRTLASSFDPLNRLESITDTVSPSVPGKTTGYLYDLSGNLLVKNQANGTVENSSYDALGRRRFQQTLSGGTSITCFSYAHDAVGNVKTITENPASTGLPDRKITNTYDRIYRLIREKADSSALAGTPASNTVTRYGYDKANNRTLKEGETLRGSTLLESFDAVSVYGSAANGANSNQLVSYDDSKTGKTTAYTYDANGNLQTRAVTGGGTETLHWDSSNRLVRVEQPAESKTHEYGYDYRSRRVIRDESGADGENSLVSFSGGTSAFETVGTSVAVEYIRGSDSGGGVGGVLYSSRNGVESFNSYNSRGDVVAQTGAGGSVKWEASYEAFGTRTAESGSNTDRHRANTKEEDPTGFLNEGYRYRDLVTGVFISRDPAGFVDGPNVYTYVNQNPWSGFDPDGLSWNPLDKSFWTEGTTANMRRASGYASAMWNTPKEIGQVMAMPYVKSYKLATDPVGAVKQVGSNYKAAWDLASNPKGTIEKAGDWLSVEENQGMVAAEVVKGVIGGKGADKVSKMAKAGPVLEAVSVEGKTTQVIATETAKEVGETATKKTGGRTGDQAKLRELADDDKASSADRGWIKHEMNSIERGQRTRIRRPPGKELAHKRGREAAKGYGYEHSNLQDKDLHKLQHKYDDFGRKNKERPITDND